MGVYHIYANLDKEEYFDPIIFGDSLRNNALFGSLSSIALRYIYSDSYPRNWNGNRLKIINDSESVTELYLETKTKFKDIGLEIFGHLIVHNEEFRNEIFKRADHNRIKQQIIQVYYDSKNIVLKKLLIEKFGKKW